MSTEGCENCDCAEHRTKLVNEIQNEIDLVQDKERNVGINLYKTGERFELCLNKNNMTITCVFCENNGSVPFSSALDAVTKMIQHSSFWHSGETH